MGATPNNEAGSGAALSTEQAAVAIRRLIRERELLPGQELRQVALARRLGMSRVPVREALQLLVAEGLVRHVPQSGYTVARLSASELQQVYLIRTLLETAVLQRIPSIDPDNLEQLRKINELLGAQVEGPDPTEFQRLNREFHFRVLGLSKLDFIVSFIERLWEISEPYRVLWAHRSDNRARSVGEHDEMIRAMEAGDLERLVELATEHRDTLATEVSDLLRS